MTVTHNKKATCHPERQHHSKGMCANCYRVWKYNNDVNQRNREVVYSRNTSRSNRYKREYGITVEDYDRMFEEQKGLCKLCGRNPHTKTRLSVDHNHATGQVRGLLCVPCNRSLGLLEDPNWREKALAYLNISDENLLRPSP